MAGQSMVGEEAIKRGENTQAVIRFPFSGVTTANLREGRRLYSRVEAPIRVYTEEPNIWTAVETPTALFASLFDRRQPRVQLIGPDDVIIHHGWLDYPPMRAFSITSLIDFLDNYLMLSVDQGELEVVGGG